MYSLSVCAESKPEGMYSVSVWLRACMCACVCVTEVMMTEPATLMLPAVALKRALGNTDQ